MIAWQSVGLRLTKSDGQVLSGKAAIQDSPGERPGELISPRPLALKRASTWSEVSSFEDESPFSQTAKKARKLSSPLNAKIEARHNLQFAIRRVIADR
jgi:hypothetical protein